MVLSTKVLAINKVMLQYFREMRCHKLKVEIWADFVCPFCYIGKRQFERALEQFPNKQHIVIEYKSFELCSTFNGESHDEPQQPCSMSIEQAQKINAHIRARAAEVGITCHGDCPKPIRTFDAHRLVKYASSLGKEAVLIESLLRAYITEARHIGERQILLDIAEEVGLNREEVEYVLATNVYSRDVKDDVQLAREIGVQGVPFFVFNEKYALLGAQSMDMFAHVLESVWKEYEENNHMGHHHRQKTKTSYCTDEGCFYIDD